MIDSKNILHWLEKIRVIDQNENFIVIDKPDGLSFYEDGPQIDLLKILRFMEMEKFFPSGERIFPIHRLDKVTSGILLFARGRKSSSILSNHFRFHRIHKIYIGLSKKIPKKKQGVIIGDMIKSRRSTWKLIKTTNNPAITLFKSFPVIDNKANYFRLFLVKPLTGKTHQIRVALKSVGAPIVGDILYNKVTEAKKEDRTYLHSYAIKFELNNKTHEYFSKPDSGKYFQLKEIREFLDELGNPFELNWNYRIKKN